MKSGYVYLLVNSALKGLVKIGKTEGDPDDRARQLSSSTGVPSPFVVVHSVYVINCKALEKKMHQRLSHCRENRKREFFRISVHEAIQILQELTAAHELVYPHPEIEVELSQVKTGNTGEPPTIVHTPNKRMHINIDNQSDANNGIVTISYIVIGVLMLCALCLAIIQQVYGIGVKIWVIAAAVLCGVGAVIAGWIAIQAGKVAAKSTEPVKDEDNVREVIYSSVHQYQAFRPEAKQHRFAKDDTESAD